MDKNGTVFVTGSKLNGGTRRDYATVAYSATRAPFGAIITLIQAGGANEDFAYAIAVDRNDNASVTGGSTDTNGTAARLVNNTRTVGGFSVTIQTEARKIYELQTTTALEADSWTAIRTVVGDGSFQIFSDAQSTGARRFYRVLIK